MIDRFHVEGVTEADFISWRHNPVTKLVTRYFRDYADALGKNALAEFIQGGDFKDGAQQEIRGRILAATDAADLGFEALVQFYRQDDQEGDHAGQAAQE